VIQRIFTGLRAYGLGHLTADQAGEGIRLDPDRLSAELGQYL
jgi:hypothetical protein